MFLLIVLYALLAGTFCLGKVLLNYTNPIFLVGIRSFIAGSIMLAYQYLYARDKLRIQKKHAGLFVQITLFTVFIPYILRYWGLLYLPSSKACLLYHFGPFFSYLLSYLICSEKITMQKIIGLIIGFCGLLPILFSAKHPASSYPILSIGVPEIAIIGAVVISSYGWIVVRKLIKDENYCYIMINGITMFGGGSMALLTSFFIQGAAYVTDIIPFIIILAVIIVVSNIICHNLYAALLKKYTPTMVSFASFLSPLFAAVYGWFFLGEIIPTSFYFSSCVVFLGLAIFSYQELKELSATKVVA